jgi:hypothetical protein
LHPAFYCTPPCPSRRSNFVGRERGRKLLCWARKAREATKGSVTSCGGGKVALGGFWRSNFRSSDQPKP